MSKSMPTARVYRYEEVVEGAKEVREYSISREVYDHFLLAFGDLSPIHVDEDYARACGFLAPVMHGTILNGFLSHFVGMHFPGRLSLLLTVDLRFAQPSYLGDTIRLEMVVNQKLEARRVVILDVMFHNATRGCLAARGRIQVLLRDEP